MKQILVILLIAVFALGCRNVGHYIEIEELKDGATVTINIEGGTMQQEADKTTDMPIDATVPLTP